MDSYAFGKLSTAVKSTQRVDGFTHNFYKYPARFSPLFANEAIRLFTEPGELVLDPFVGGGTTIIEASTLGRKSIGVDINSLATFITKVKTTPLDEDQLLQIQKWTNLINNIKLRALDEGTLFWKEKGYLKNMSDKDTWRIRNYIGLILNSINEINDHDAREFIRCALLRTGQWALDGKSTIPSISDFRNKFIYYIEKMIVDINNYSENTMSFFADNKTGYLTILHRSSIGLEEESIFTDQSPKLILMSPPYPGVHILYHRWQIRSRRETPVPYWIADKLDGNGESHYTIGSRQSHQKQEYFCEMRKIFDSLAKISNNETVIVQLLAFSDPDNQLPRYLSLMNKSGFDEIFLTSNKTRKRIWRDVPNRRWYTKIKERTTSSKEVVLIHRKKTQ